MYCAKCGNKTIENAKFCAKCGNAVAQQVTPQQSSIALPLQPPVSISPQQLKYTDEQPSIEDTPSSKGLAGKIFGLLISIGLIIGGLSGNFVLRGTNSSGALVVVGCLFLIGDIVSLATHNKKPKPTTN